MPNASSMRAMPNSPQRKHLLVARNAVLACPIGVRSFVFVEI
jgi:hypothetical protein